MALKQALKNNDKNEKLLEMYMLANYWLGYSAYLQVDYDTAEPYLAQYLKYAETLFLLYPKMAWQLETSYALNNLGSLAEKNNQLNLASDYFEQSAQIKLSILESQPNNLSIRADLADTRSWQSNLQAKSGKLSVAISFLQEALVQVEKNNSIEDSYNNIGRLADLEHKIALLYFDTGNLVNAQIYCQKSKKNILKLVNNDDENHLLKIDLLWSHILSIQIFINQHKLDNALIYLDQVRTLMNQLNRSATQTIEVIRANVDLLQYQAQTMALLKQNQSALLAINDAIKLFKQNLSVDIDTTFYARLVLSKINILSASSDVDLVVKSQRLIETELTEIKTLLEAKLQTNKTDYKTIAIYLMAITLLKQLPVDDPWLKLYQASDYNIPDYSRLTQQRNATNNE
jgi:tetratricopeptide (TPR) repeat protein